jgi:hypothetical protein
MFLKFENLSKIKKVLKDWQLAFECKRERYFKVFLKIWEKKKN